MKYLATACAILLLAASGGVAADPVFEETLVGEVGPPVVNYYSPLIQELAKKEKRPLVLFRGGAKPRHIVRARCCYDFPNEKPSIMVAAVANPLEMSACLPGDATDDQIYEAVKKSIAGFVMHAPATARPDVMIPPVTIDRTGAVIRIFRNDRVSETITLPADATEAQVKAACVKLAPEVYAAPSCTGQGCNCGYYGGGSGACGCPANYVLPDCPGHPIPQAVGGISVTPIYVGPPSPLNLGPTPSVFPLTPVQGQPLQLRTGVIRGGS